VGIARAALGHLVWLLLLPVQALVSLVATLVVGPVVIVLSLVGQFAAAHRWLRLWCRVVLAVFMVRSSIAGLENLPRTGGYIMVANHYNRFEGPCLLLELGEDFDIAISRRLSLVPLWGQAAVCLGFLPIDRRNAAVAGRRIDGAVETVRRGRRILFFPEGRRDWGGAFLPFKKGAYRLAVDAGVPIVPIAVSDDRTTGRRRDSLVFAVGEPIPTAGLGRKDIPTLVAKSRSAIVALRASRSRPGPSDTPVSSVQPAPSPGPRSDRPGERDRAGG